MCIIIMTNVFPRDVLVHVVFLKHSPQQYSQAIFEHYHPDVHHHFRHNTHVC